MVIAFDAKGGLGNTGHVCPEQKTAV